MSTVDPDASTDTHFRGLLETAPDAVVITDEDGRIMLVNGQTERMFGYSRDELLGRSVDVLLPERFQGTHSGHRQGYAANPHTRPMGIGLDLYARRRDGVEVPVEISLSPMREGDRLFVTSIIRDITLRRQTEGALKQARAEAEAANRAKSEFLSRMSHELRTPLNAILGFGQLLELDLTEPTQRKHVERILKGGRHLLDLINEVLDIARIETGQLQLSREPVRMSDALREALDLVRPMAAERAIQLGTDALDICDQHVMADRQRLTQVLLNLVANAVKYNRPGGTVTVSCAAAPGGRLRMEIRDTGPGIPAERQSRLFAPFDRLGAETSGIEGTGLGLALSKGLTEAMGGAIGVESRAGEGSAFWVELDAAERRTAPDAGLPGGLRRPQETAGDNASHTILYIEDNLSNLELIEGILARWPGTNLLAAMQGRLGIELARKHRPDLILLDLHLPDVSGSEVLAVLRDDPVTRAIPVVMITADATPGQRERLLEAGAHSYLTKPLDISRFLTVVREALEGGER